LPYNELYVLMPKTHQIVHQMTIDYPFASEYVFLYSTHRLLQWFPKVVAFPKMFAWRNRRQRRPYPSTGAPRHGLRNCTACVGQAYPVQRGGHPSSTRELQAEPPQRKPRSTPKAIQSESRAREQSCPKLSFALFLGIRQSAARGSTSTEKPRWTKKEGRSAGWERLWCFL